MKNNYKFLTIISMTIVLSVLTACGNPEESNSKSSNDTDSKSTQNENEESTSNSDNEVTTNQKEKYLDKLNEMEESDRHAETKSTISDMEEQEKERYEKWDQVLNEIYRELKKQLSEDQMDKLRVEQRNWIKHRDEAAKEASLKYEGGSTETLEYIATQASLTKERCYKLVAHYMK
ncbi:hypothetical protein CEY16_09025 [Halalkalibacillus sediminis]|uniref:Lysozyme inhibitor LprI-like N-terminal domain-containing protein n=1 Tax=Halalkalibacillus sediminis TaxID=2018042 RepID=A0A2I0QUR5_9BACI|nr:lysozyme inhibitor LprI family protein [Halalkalibacillus sediminis]PKR78048.1 hypothetical protein CEY16_09025 [Halalkalibacillus sediminis]